MELRLIEPACGCSNVQGGGGRKVRAFSAGTVMESACRQAPGTWHLQVVCLCNGTTAMELRLIEQCLRSPAPRCDAEVDEVLARLCRWHSGGECLPPGTRHLARACGLPCL